MHLNSDLLLNIGKKYGTPLYVYNKECIVKRYNELGEYIKYPKTRFFYAMKANSNFEILKVIEKENGYIDAVSPAEVFLALKAGFSPDRILYTANNTKECEMNEVEKTGVLFNIGSLSRLDKFGRNFPGSNVCLRFNPDVEAGAHEFIRTGGQLTKFGILLGDVDIVLEIVQKYNLKVVGLHEHTGSGISETSSVYQSMKNLLSIAKKDFFPDLEFIDFGGGFKVPYSPLEKRIDYVSFGENLTEIFENFCREYGKDLYMYFEPGKYIVAESGYLLVQVNTLKNNRGRLIAGTDSGFSQLVRPMYYGAYHHILNLSNMDGTMKKYDICGNICESGDCFARDRILPEVREGDILCIQNAGAYGFSQGSTYNTRPLPAEILVEDGMNRVIRKGMSNMELAEKIISDCSC